VDFSNFADLPIIDGHVHFSHLERMGDVLGIMDFERVYGATPAPLNREAALAELERLAAEIDALAGGEAEENAARQVAERLEGMGNH
jgi:hypothetical protein